MQFEKAKQLRDDLGDKPCEHPDFEKEYYLGAHTGDYVCVQCGNCLTDEEKQAIRNKLKNQH